MQENFPCQALRYFVHGYYPHEECSLAEIRSRYEKDFGHRFYLKGAQAASLCLCLADRSDLKHVYTMVLQVGDTKQ